MKELKTMLDLQKFEAKTLANHQQQQKELDHLLPIIEDAGTVIVEKLALFKKYNRKVRSRVRCMVINGHLRK
mgnify:FL=1